MSRPAAEVQSESAPRTQGLPAAPCPGPPAIAVGAVIGLAACGSAVPGARHPAAAGTGHVQEPAAVSTSLGMPLRATAQTVDRVVASPMSSQFREILPRGTNHDRGRAPGSYPGSRTLHATAYAARAALPGCARRGGPAEVRSRRAGIPGGPYPELRVPDCHRGRPDPLVVGVPAVRAAAEPDSWRPRPTDPPRTSEQRADGLTGRPRIGGPERAPAEPRRPLQPGADRSRSWYRGRGTHRLQHSCAAGHNGVKCAPDLCIHGDRRSIVSDFRMKLSAHWVGWAGLASRQWG